MKLFVKLDKIALSHQPTSLDSGTGSNRKKLNMVNMENVEEILCVIHELQLKLKTCERNRETFVGQMLTSYFYFSNNPA